MSVASGGSVIALTLTPAHMTSWFEVFARMPTHGLIYILSTGTTEEYRSQPWTEMLRAFSADSDRFTAAKFVIGASSISSSALR